MVEMRTGGLRDGRGRRESGRLTSVAAPPALCLCCRLLTPACMVERSRRKRAHSAPGQRRVGGVPWLRKGPGDGLDASTHHYGGHNSITFCALWTSLVPAPPQAPGRCPWKLLRGNVSLKKWDTAVVGIDPRTDPFIRAIYWRDNPVDRTALCRCRRWTRRRSSSRAPPRMVEDWGDSPDGESCGIVARSMSDPLPGGGGSLRSGATSSTCHKT